MMLLLFLKMTSHRPHQHIYIEDYFMNKRKSIIIATLVILSVWGIIKYRSGHANYQPQTVWVAASAVKETTLPLETRAIGTLVARSVDITPEVAGHVDKILFKDGTFVTKGTPLIQLDDAVFQAQYQSAKAQLGLSESNYKRSILLIKYGAITKQAVDQAAADLKEKQAIADESAVRMQKMLLTAPFDGVIGKSNVNPGDYVNIGQKLVSLTDVKHLRVEYNISERRLASLKLGQHVKITAAAYPGKTFDGVVSFISPTINISSRSLALYADVPNDNQLLAPGMFVNVVQGLGTETKVVMIPARSLVPVSDGEQVYKIVDGKAFAIDVLIGQRKADDVQITAGLSPGDVVITDGQIKVRNGMPVKIKT